MRAPFVVPEAIVGKQFVSAIAIANYDAPSHSNFAPAPCTGARYDRSLQRLTFNRRRPAASIATLDGDWWRKHADAHEEIGDPAADISYQTSVTCEKQPIVIFNSIKWNRVRGGGTPDGVYAFNLRTKELTV